MDNKFSDFDSWMAEVTRLTEVLDEEHYWDLRKEKWFYAFEKGYAPLWLVETCIELRNME